MGNISKGTHAERSDPPAAFLRYNGRDRGGGGTDAVPEYHGRDIQQVAEEHALQPEVTEKHNGIVVGPERTVEWALPLIAVLL